MPQDIIKPPVGYTKSRFGGGPWTPPEKLTKVGSKHVDFHTLNTLRRFQFKERVESQCVNDVEYNPETQQMTIVFQQRGTYVYDEVPLDVYVDFETSGSRGKYFNYYIKDRFNTERIA